MRPLTALMLGASIVALAAVPVAMATAASIGNPLVLELFTSQGCSSCPPADAYAAELARTRPDLLVLDFHVDYWDKLGWHDPFSLPAATARQETYDERLHTETYTPQLVIGGSEQAIGSARADVTDAISLAESDRAALPAVALSLEPAGSALRAQLGKGTGSGTLWLVGYDASHTTSIGRGENDGLRETEVDIVRSIVNLGNWTALPETITAARPAGERYAVLLQRADGTILAAARLASPGS